MGNLFEELSESCDKGSCTKVKVGCLILDQTGDDYFLLSHGYNRHPIFDTCTVPCSTDDLGSCMEVMHAEQMALHSLENKNLAKGSLALVSLSPCMGCARLLLSYHVSRVWYVESYAELKGKERDYGVEYLEAYGVEVQRVSEDFLKLCNIQR